MPAPAAGPIDTGSASFLSFESPLHAQGAREGMGVSAERDPAVPLASLIERPAGVYTLRRSKIERPILPLETLRRDRLLDWLDSAVRRRLTFVVAEAGFGKTTLLADFARRTRFRTIWYRIDEDDIDPISFLRYFIAACRSIDPSLLARSDSLLIDSATQPIPWEAIFDAVCSELGSLASEPTVLFFDDYHLAERYGPVRQIVERLIARAPEALTFVVASRRPPNLAVARLRACDDLAELGREQLRFDPDETERLFREVYSQPLDTDVLSDLQSRTEGWVASLQLVKAAVRGRTASDVRQFIRTLSAGEGELYDYLAEEVIADLPDETQRFLSRVSILDEIDPLIAAPAADMGIPDARVQLNSAQRLGLVSRTARVLGPARLHPLVRDFLEARLIAEIGESGVIALHRRVAVLYEPISWRSAARHWAAAGDGDDVCRVVQGATGTILGTGEFEAADDFITRFAGPAPNPWFDILRSRVAYARRDMDEAERLGNRAHDLVSSMREEPGLRQIGALHSLYMAFESHDAPLTSARATSMAGEELDDEGIAISAAAAAIAEDQDLRQTPAKLERVRSIARARGRGRYEGIAEVNLATTARILGDFGPALRHAEAAVRLLTEFGTPDERGAAKMTKAQILAHVGDIEAARVAALEAMTDWPVVLMTAETADMLAMYSSPEEARDLLDEQLVGTTGDLGQRSVLALAQTRVLAIEGRYNEAQAMLSSLQGRPVYCGYRSQVDTMQALLSVMRGSLTAGKDVAQAVRTCETQGARYWGRVARLLEGVLGTNAALNAAIQRCSGTDRPYLSIVAELLIPRTKDLVEGTRSVVRAEAESRPSRWRSSLRRFLENSPGTASAVEAGRLLEVIGNGADIRLLRRLAKQAPRSARAGRLGCELIHRLAPRYLIEDLGPVVLTTRQPGEARYLFGADIRRKVLALLCLLLTRPHFAATVDQVVDALWPGLDPETGSNSLNQTIYFLRRVLEPAYDDQTTAEYVRHERDLVWLDTDLISSRSTDCWALIKAAPNDTASLDALAESYTAPFALDFVYEDWAAVFRDSLHARYLSVLETAIRRETEAGGFEHAIWLAQRATQVDPEAVQIELCLLRLYRLTGAQSAAAEQYSHYVTVYREETGLDPPPLETL